MYVFFFTCACYLSMYYIFSCVYIIMHIVCVCTWINIGLKVQSSCTRSLRNQKNMFAFFSFSSSLSHWVWPFLSSSLWASLFSSFPCPTPLLSSSHELLKNQEQYLQLLVFPQIPSNSWNSISSVAQVFKYQIYTSLKTSFVIFEPSTQIF